MLTQLDWLSLLFDLTLMDTCVNRHDHRIHSGACTFLLVARIEHNQGSVAFLRLEHRSVDDHIRQWLSSAGSCCCCPRPCDGSRAARRNALLACTPSAGCHSCRSETLPPAHRPRMKHRRECEGGSTRLLVVQLQRDERLARRILEFNVVQDLDLLSRARCITSSPGVSG